VNTTRRDLNSLDIPQNQKFLMGTVGEENSRDLEKVKKPLGNIDRIFFTYPGGYLALTLTISCSALVQVVVPVVEVLLN
jgi:hypothetical protein